MPNVINWFDIATSDFDRAVKFYSEILGKPVKLMPMGEVTLGFFPMEGEGIGGDIVPPNPDFKPGPGGTHVHLNVEGQLDETLARVEPAGGKIVRARTLITPEVGYFAFIQDTEGNIVGLHSTK